MTLNEFRENFSGAAVDDDELASSAAKITDCKKLKDAATAYLSAKEWLDFQYQQFDIEMG